MKTLKIESALLEYVKKHIDVLFIVIMTVLAAAIRYYGKDFLGGDMRGYLIPWHEEFSAKGFAGLKEQVGDYNIPYQILVWLMTLVPIKPIYAYKIVSCFFDFLMAAAGGKIIKECTGSKALSVGAYAALLFLPAVIFNSAFLGQSDAIFTAFVLLAVLQMKKHYFWFFIFLGCAFSFKLQFVFIIPLFVICYVCMSKFSVLNFVLIPLTLMVLSIPAYIAGRPVMDVFKIYFFQVYHTPCPLF